MVGFPAMKLYSYLQYMNIMSNNKREFIHNTFRKYVYLGMEYPFPLLLIVHAKTNIVFDNNGKKHKIVSVAVALEYCSAQQNRSLFLHVFYCM
jgi:hypothetical protein